MEVIISILIVTMVVAIAVKKELTKGANNAINKH